MDRDVEQQDNLKIEISYPAFAFGGAIFGIVCWVFRSPSLLFFAFAGAGMFIGIGALIRLCISNEPEISLADEAMAEALSHPFDPTERLHSLEIRQRR